MPTTPNAPVAASTIGSTQCAGVLAIRPCNGCMRMPRVSNSGAPLLYKPQRQRSSSNPSSHPRPLGSAIGTNAG
ncbi:MAG: hypothetical protein QM811_18870 [Pirellulales bacterium]